jgi:hypothetical protein
MKRTLKRRLALAAPLLAPFAMALAMPACGDEQLEAVVKALGEGCLIDSDCQDELVCVYRRCHHECETDKDCVSLGVGPYCRLGDRPTHICLLSDEQGCQTHADCPAAAMVCSVDDICRDACADVSECLPDQSCMKGACGNIEAEGLDASHPLLNEDKGAASEPCIYNSQCLSPLACIQGLCREECIDDRDCPSNATCVVIPDADLPDTKACVVTETPTMTPTGPGPEHCSDGTTSGDESGVDCGGSCAPCPSGGGCGDAADCTSGVCSSGICQSPTCNDGVRNGTELAVDCGGACPNGCPTGTTCTTSGDCTAPDTCDVSQGICVAPECNDGLKNNDESDVDCGGPNCGACDPLKDCVTAGDCTSLVCAAGTCLPAGCSDGVQNGNESDVDCGGPASGCATCGNGAACTQSDQCASGSCDAMSSLCVAPSCSDGMQNGFELGVDCGGPGCSAGCALGTACTVDSDCDQTSPAACHPTNLTCTALRTVTVTVAGSGSGTVASTPVGIGCGVDCEMTVFDGATVQLDATAGVNSSFSGFSGDCAGPSPCVLSVSGDAAVTAAFDPTGPGITNWHVDPSTGNIAGGAIDSAGHVITGAGGGDWGCGSLTGSSDFSIAKYVPGPASKSDACVASIIDGGLSAQALLGLHVEPNDDVAVVFSANGSFNLAGNGTKTCTNSQGFALAWYDNSLSQTAHQVTDCLGPALIRDTAQLPNGDILVAGTMGLTTDLGDTMTYSSTNGRMFLAIYDDLTGNFVAAHQFGSNADILEDVSVDPTNGDIVVTLRCQGATDYGSMIVSVDAGNNSYDICAAKFNASLVPQWAFQVGSASGGEGGVASAFMPGGDVAVTGYFSTQVHFGDGIFHDSVGLTDIAVIHVDGMTGALKSAVPNSSWRAYGTPADDEPAAVMVVPSGMPGAGAIFVAGGTRDPGGIDVGGGMLTPGHGLFLAKYPTFGTHAWSASSHTNLVAPYDSFGDFFIASDGTPWFWSNASIVTNTDWGSGQATSPFVARLNP